MLAGGAGIFNSRIGSFWAWSYGELGGLLVVVGPGSRISTVDCSRVLNVNMSLYGRTSRVERSEMFCERSEPALYAAPTCTTGEAPVYVFVSMVVLPEDSTDHYFQFCRMRVCVRSVGILKTSKNFLTYMFPTGNGLAILSCLDCRIPTVL